MVQQYDKQNYFSAWICESQSLCRTEKNIIMIIITYEMHICRTFVPIFFSTYTKSGVYYDVHLKTNQNQHKCMNIFIRCVHRSHKAKECRTMKKANSIVVSFNNPIRNKGKLIKLDILVSL